MTIAMLSRRHVAIACIAQQLPISSSLATPIWATDGRLTLVISPPLFFSSVKFFLYYFFSNPCLQVPWVTTMLPTTCTWPFGVRMVVQAMAAHWKRIRGIFFRICHLADQAGIIPAVLIGATADWPCPATWTSFILIPLGTTSNVSTRCANLQCTRWGACKAFTDALVQPCGPLRRFARSGWSW